MFTEPAGSVAPPKDADGNYRSHLHCVWKVRVPLSERVAVDFGDEFALEGGNQCHFDFLALYDGPDSSAPLVGKYCDNDKPPRFVSTSNSITVVFHSDMSFEMSGFTMNYEVCECHLEEDESSSRRASRFTRVLCPSLRRRLHGAARHHHVAVLPQLVPAQPTLRVRDPDAAQDGRRAAVPRL